MNEIINIDCMDYMTNMDDVSVDFTLTDIPYNTLTENIKLATSFN